MTNDVLRIKRNAKRGLRHAETILESERTDPETARFRPWYAKAIGAFIAKWPMAAPATGRIMNTGSVSFVMNAITNATPNTTADRMSIRFRNCSQKANANANNADSTNST